MKRKVIIIGGVAGGATAAARLRRLDEHAEILLIERGEYISYANCGLPYYIGGDILEKSDLLVQTVECFSKRYKLDIRINSEVIKINRNNKTITIKNLIDKSNYEETYDTLILSPGAQPIKPNLLGIKEASNIYTIRNIPDAEKIKKFITDNNPKKATIIGGGFIGIEMAENLYQQGIKVTIVELTNQICPSLDFEMASIIQNHLKDKGVNLIIEDGVKEFRDKGKTIFLNSGKIVSSDLTILSIGVKPEITLAKDAGLKIGTKGGIIVNTFLQTSDKDIYAIGDAIEVMNYINGNLSCIPLAWPAARQGRIIAGNVCGEKIQFSGTLGTCIVKVFDMITASTGLNERMLIERNMNYQVAHTHSPSHAGYYPNSNNISLKILFDPYNGKIFGAQAVGIDGVDKRIDILATAIKGGLNINQLPDIEIAYAPPFSSSKDPINILGYVASNILNGDVETVQWHEINQIIKDGNTVIDVRDECARIEGHIKGTINIPLTELRDRLNELDKKKTIYIYCKIGLTGYIACRILIQNGYNVKNLDGGYLTYSNVYGC